MKESNNKKNERKIKIKIGSKVNAITRTDAWSVKSSSCNETARNEERNKRASEHERWRIAHIAFAVHSRLSNKQHNRTGAMNKPNFEHAHSLQ